MKKLYIAAVVTGLLMSAASVQAGWLDDYLNGRNFPSLPNTTLNSTVMVSGTTKAQLTTRVNKGEKIKFQVTKVSGKSGGKVNVEVKIGSRTVKKSIDRVRGKSVTVTASGTGSMTLKVMNAPAGAAGRYTYVKITK